MSDGMEVEVATRRLGGGRSRMGEEKVERELSFGGRVRTNWSQKVHGKRVAAAASGTDPLCPPDRILRPPPL
jgi:hypothetical protein